MGAWAEDTFGNDTACDWAGDFLDNPGLPAVQSAIYGVLACDGYLNLDEAANCLAACGVLARWQGQWGLRNPYSEQLDAWIEAHPVEVPARLRSAADQAIEKILGPDSELRQLWDEGGYNSVWHDDVNNLRQRIFG